MHVRTTIVVAALSAVASPALGQLNYVSGTRSVSASAGGVVGGVTTDSASSNDLLAFVRGVDVSKLPPPPLGPPPGSPPITSHCNQASSLQPDWLFVNGSLESHRYYLTGGGSVAGGDAVFNFDVTFTIAAPVPFRMYGSFVNDSAIELAEDDYELALTRNGTERIFWRDAGTYVSTFDPAHLPGPFDLSGLLQPGSYQLQVFLRERTGKNGGPTNSDGVGGVNLVLEVPGAGTLAAFAPLGLFGLRRRR